MIELEKLGSFKPVAFVPRYIGSAQRLLKRKGMVIIMKKRFVRLKLSQQVALICAVFILIPMLILLYTALRTAADTAVETRMREVQTGRNQFMAKAEYVAELCNISTRVFLNTPALTRHLYALKTGSEPDTPELLEFYREDLVGLEKIILSNPDLDHIRVYADADGIHEMMPILYSASRMERMPWAEAEIVSGSWYFDFDDQLFPNYPVTHHILSLITEITAPDVGKIGVLEVSVCMDKIMPSLFSDDKSSGAALLDGDGNVIAGTTYMKEANIGEIPFSDEPVQLTLDGRRVLAVKTEVRELDCVYLQITDMSDIYLTIAWRAAGLFIIFIAAALLMTVAVYMLTRHILRGFYGAFDGIRAFALGDTQAVVEVKGVGEIADFAKEAGGLLDQLRQFMRENLEREVRIQRAETRALQNQINAHFIYNVLEAIKMMAEIDEKYEIADAVTSLGKLLRYSMKLEGENVELERELEYIKNYIDLMNLRFDYVITLVTDIPEELLGQRIPKISLQPIVENAVVYGAASLASDSTVCISGEINRDLGRFTVSITDEGMGMDEGTLERIKRQISGEEPPRSRSGNGIGLKNVHDRIRLSFGENYGLRVESRSGIGTTVMVDLPYTDSEGSKENCKNNFSY